MLVAVMAKLEKLHIRREMILGFDTMTNTYQCCDQSIRDCRLPIQPKIESGPLIGPISAASGLSSA